MIVGAVVVARFQLSLEELIGNGLDLHALVTRGSLEYLGETTDVLVREFMSSGAPFRHPLSCTLDRGF